MARDVDERKKRAALRKLRKAAELAEQGLGPPLSDWEREFLEEVEQRIETYGSAFADPLKGEEGEALSGLQKLKLKEIDKKARGKGKQGFRSKKKAAKRPPPRVRQLDEDVDEATEEMPTAPAPAKKQPLKLVRPEGVKPASELLPETPEPDSTPKAETRPKLRVIRGGQDTPEI